MNQPNRRTVARAALAAGLGPSASGSSLLASDLADQTIRNFLKSYVMDRPSVEAFLDPKARVWAKFDPDTGYLLRNSFMRDGMDGSHTLARYEPTGQRYQVNYRDQPSRINTYGNSFTRDTSPTMAKPGRRFWPLIMENPFATGGSAVLAFTKLR